MLHSQVFPRSSLCYPKNPRVLLPTAYHGVLSSPPLFSTSASWFFLMNAMESQVVQAEYCRSPYGAPPDSARCDYLNGSPGTCAAHIFLDARPLYRGYRPVRISAQVT
jgi:hypothetical protein